MPAGWYGILDAVRKRFGLSAGQVWWDRHPACHLFRKGHVRMDIFMNRQARCLSHQNWRKCATELTNRVLVARDS
jgi:hypothetical protein